MSPSEFPIPLEFVQKNVLLPIEEQGKLKVGVCPETPREALEDLRLLLNRDVEPVPLTRQEVDEGIRLLITETVGEASGEDEDLLTLDEDTQDLLSLSKGAPIIRLVNSLFLRAINSHASDIHIEPYERESLVRLRIDGVLHEVLSIPASQFAAVISRLKVMAKLNLAEHRLPQDGRIRVKAGEKLIDVRVSIVPTLFGERAVMRLLDRTVQLLTLASLGISKENYARVRDLIGHSYGSVLVTGPTGSGKSTTLYAILQEVQSPNRNIITIEDPVEFQIKGIGQIQVNPKVGMKFADGLRSILRQDPDVIMVGEIRDPETAEIATHASLTGHLVLSTLHTNDAPTAVSRLVDMGVESFLVSASLLGIIAQRLVRKLCQKCRTPYHPREDELLQLGLNGIKTSAVFYKPKGCPECMNTGFVGRIGVFEIMLIDDELRHLISMASEASVLRAAARKKGMKTLLEDAAQKVLDGLSCTEEVLRVTGGN